MFFTVLPSGTRLPAEANGRAFLLTDNWDDWFKFSTMYVLFYYDDEGEQHRIGEVKIGQFGLTSEQRRPPIPPEFDALNDTFFSLGQDDTYYEKANKFGEEIRRKFLNGLRDVAVDNDLFEHALDEEVMGVSLLRSVSRSSVRGQFRRIANGGVRLTSYAFSYEPPRRRTAKLEPVKFTFKVKPDSNPPSNIHVLIGRNGVGKTHHLQLMTRALVERDAEAGDVGKFRNDDIHTRISRTIRNPSLRTLSRLRSAPSIPSSRYPFDRTNPKASGISISASRKRLRQRTERLVPPKLRAISGESSGQA